MKRKKRSQILRETTSLNSIQKKRRDRRRRLDELMVQQFAPPPTIWSEHKNYAKLAIASHRLKSALTAKLPDSKRSLTPAPARQIKPSNFILPTLRELAPKTKPTVCLSRSTRRNTLFALRIAGTSGGSPGKNNTYRRIETSNRSCK